MGVAAGPGAARQPAIPVYEGWDAFSDDERAALWDKMLRALAAQRDSRFDVAGQLYEEVLARAPLPFDALHMLGVVRLMDGDYDEAESLLTRARELAPGDDKVRHNLALLQQRRADHQGLYSLRSIVATDMLRLFGAGGPLAKSDALRFFVADDGGPAHTNVVIPAVPTMAGSNRTGSALVRRLGANATLWAGPECDGALADWLSARCWSNDGGGAPRGGRLVVFGLHAGIASWLPAVAASYDAIVLALDAHDPSTCVDLLGRMDEETLRRVHFVARSAALLEDLGLPGDVDPMLFDGSAARARRSRPERRRIGVFIPALRDREDAERWQMLEWLRAQPHFLRVLYPGRLPSPHLPSAEEHLIGLATQWAGWNNSLDALFYWGADGHMRQYDRLVFEALDAGQSVVADGFGDFGAAMAERSDCVQFFDAAGARAAVGEMLRSSPEAVDAEGSLA